MTAISPSDTTAAKTAEQRSERVIAFAENVFGDPAKAHRWLRQPKRSLDGEAPLACLASESGARAVEEMLRQIQHGMVV